MKKHIISIMLVFVILLSCGIMTTSAQTEDNNTVTFYFHCPENFTKDGTVRCALTPNDNILECDFIYGQKSINNFYKFVVPNFSSYCWFTIDNGVDAQYEADPNVNVTDAFMIAEGSYIYDYDSDELIDINEKIYTNFAIHWADWRYYYGLGDWMEYDQWSRFHKYLNYTSNRNFDCSVTDFSYWFKYKELYTFNNNILSFGAYDKKTNEPSYGVYGDYVLRNNETYFPSTFGYNVYVSKSDEVISLRKAYDTNIDGIESVFTDYGIGELIGDVNNDKSITIFDATIIQKNLVQLSDFASNDEIQGNCEDGSVSISYMSDFNRDTDRNIMDATAIQMYLAKKQ